MDESIKRLKLIFTQTLGTVRYCSNKDQRGSQIETSVENQPKKRLRLNFWEMVGQAIGQSRPANFDSSEENI